MLVTLFLTTYNRAHCVEAAIDAMFRLPVPEGMEIEYLISDDCSTDNTFDLIQRKTAQYIQSHNVIVNRNPVNLKQGLHLQKIMNLGHGKWFVECDSDDFSLDNRLTELMRCIALYPNMRGFCSGRNIIDINNHSDYSGVLNGQLFPCGATCAWHRDCFDCFDEVTEPTCSQDVYIPFRALLLGDWIFSDTATVNYQIGYDNDSTPFGLNRINSLRHLIKIKEHLILAIKQRLHDLKYISNVSEEHKKILTDKHTTLIKKLNTDIVKLNLQVEYLSKNIFGKLVMFSRIASGLSPRKFNKLRLALELCSPLAELIQWIKKYFKSHTKKKKIENPTGQIKVVTLDFLIENPDEFLIML